MDSNDALQMIFERNQFYRRQCMLALGAFGMALLVICALIFVLIFVIRNPIAPLYFATDNVGRLIKVVPVSEPNMSPEEVSKWVTHAVEAANTYDYVNYRTQLQSAQKYFTPYGWLNYMNGLRASNNLIGVTKRRLIVQAQVVDVPKMVAHGTIAGAYGWQYELNLLVVFRQPPYDDKSSFSNTYNVTLIIKRLPILQSSDGLGILQMVSTALDATPQSQDIMSPDSTS
jgi:intracellular multiplication protein IcmL